MNALLHALVALMICHLHIKSCSDFVTAALQQLPWMCLCVHSWQHRNVFPCFTETGRQPRAQVGFFGHGPGIACSTVPSRPQRELQRRSGGTAAAVVTFTTSRPGTGREGRDSECTCGVCSGLCMSATLHTDFLPHSMSSAACGEAD